MHCLDPSWWLTLNLINLKVTTRQSSNMLKAELNCSAVSARKRGAMRRLVRHMQLVSVQRSLTLGIPTYIQSCCCQDCQIWAETRHRARGRAHLGEDTRGMSAKQPSGTSGSFGRISIKGGESHCVFSHHNTTVSPVWSPLFSLLWSLAFIFQIIRYHPLGMTVNTKVPYTR